MFLYTVKGFGVLGWLVRGGDGLDPGGGASFEFGQVAGAAFDLADAAGVDAEGVTDLLLGDAVCDAQLAEPPSAFDGRFAGGCSSLADGDEGPVGLAGDEAFQAANDLPPAFSFPRSSDSRSRGWAGGSACGRGDAAQSGVALPVAASVEPVPVGLTAGSRDGAGAAELSERGLAANAFGIVAGDDGQHRRRSPCRRSKSRAGDGRVPPA